MHPSALHLFRILFFASLAIDYFKRIGLAANVAVDGYDATHLPSLLDEQLQRLLRSTMSGSTREYAMQVTHVLCNAIVCVLCITLAIDAGIDARSLRHRMVALSVVSTLALVVSQRDMFQHHYLLVLLFYILCWLDETKPRRQEFVASLLSAQLGVVYFWTAVAKIDRDWISGAVPDMVTRGPLRDYLLGAGISRRLVFSALAVSTIVVELILCALLLARAYYGKRTRASVRWCILALALPLHVGLDNIGLYIEYFSFYMCLLVVLLATPYSVAATFFSPVLEMNFSVTLLEWANVLSCAYLARKNPLPLWSLPLLNGLIVWPCILLAVKFLFRSRRVVRVALLVALLGQLYEPAARYHLLRGGGLSRRHQYVEALHAHEQVRELQGGVHQCDDNTVLAIASLAQRANVSIATRIELLREARETRPNSWRIDYGAALAELDRTDELQRAGATEKEVRRAQTRACLEIRRFETHLVEASADFCQFTPECDREMDLAKAQRAHMADVWHAQCTRLEADGYLDVEAI